MRASIEEKKGYLYVKLTYRVNNERKFKTVLTGLKAKGNKALLKSKLDDYIREYEYLETGCTEDELTLLGYVEKFLDEHKDEIELSTWESYICAYEAHIKPYFTAKKLKLTEVTPKTISDFYSYLHTSGNHKTGEGLSAASIKKIATVLKISLKEARIIGLIDNVPTYGVRIPKGGGKKQPKKVYMNKEDAKKVLDAFKGHMLYPIVYMTLFYGLRRSEIIGLKWENVDLDNDTFEIKSTIVRCKSLIKKDRTKTEDSNAQFELLPRFKEILIGLKERAENNKALLGDEYLDKGYVFCWDNGDFIKPDYVSNNYSKRIKEVGLPHMRFHDLRHSTASILFDMGWDIERIKNWLRHSDIRTTSNVYTHISNDRKKIMAKEIDDFLD